MNAIAVIFIDIAVLLSVITYNKRVIFLLAFVYLLFCI